MGARDARKRLVLVGGGHSQIEVLRGFGMNPLPDVSITAITREIHAPYSGMLPGYIAGHYSYAQCHIDVRPLAQYARARFYHDEVTGIDLAEKRVLMRDHPPVEFDLLSINIGSRPATSHVAGSLEHSLPVKPVDKFIERWESLVARIVEDRPASFRFLTVGGGAGGVELTLTMQYQLQNLLAAEKNSTTQLEFHIALADSEIMLTHNRGVRTRMNRILKDRGIHVHSDYNAAKVDEHGVESQDGKRIDYDALLWVTHAAPAPWIADTGLKTDDEGFILVDEYLRSHSHPFVFATGDVATLAHDPKPKSGVYAVREGPFLKANLRHTLLEEPLEVYEAQKHFLSLITTGDKNAIASRKLWAAQSPLLWTLKDYIDQKFMRKYRDFPDMNADMGGENDGEMMEMHCAGCGSKVGSRILTNVLRDIETHTNPGVVVGLDAPDDAAVIDLPDGALSVQTVDFFRSFLADHYQFGRVAAVHCLSDIHAMGATPQSALAVVTLAYDEPARQEDVLRDLLAGAASVLSEENTALVGGHTIQGPELSFGLTVNGYIHPDRMLKKGGMQPGDPLILTKPLGTGVLFAADMRGKGRGPWLDGAVRSMLVSNANAARRFFEHGATACTDVTGFGLMGHLVEMLEQSRMDCSLTLAAIPTLKGAIQMSLEGVTSTLFPDNAQVASVIRNPGRAVQDPRYNLLFDPQTAGGLLASVPAARAEDCLKALYSAGYPHAAIVGRVKARSDTPAVFLE